MIWNMRKGDPAGESHRYQVGVDLMSVPAIASCRWTEWALLLYTAARLPSLICKGEMNTRFVVCVKNEGFAASLERRKIYAVIQDARASEHQMIRVVDESGEDYLYPAGYFVAIELPQEVEEALSLAA